ncbi:hypothetical protein RJ53_03935 [Methanocalculus chunghsingensis]|uniref:YprB ribonuclease H-like domain-containing protein n=1 Tax=Methanocalculus chunghsingensis TaxID=156457 RepID=A0A8J7W5J9_9EURY|nr:ribonuclease H-like domain-containing protein [Methanocalculus chunghsingensis]MBR1368701.1 hypothetical protein [Methanocalculus chunghsingensis]
MAGTAGGFRTARSLWRERLDPRHEYRVIEHDNRFRAGIGRTGIFASEFQRFEEEKERLCDLHAGSDLGEIIAGDIIDTPEGECFGIGESVSCPPLPLDPDAARAHLLRSLRLVPGIGPAHERRLKQKGCRTIRDLLHIRRYRPSAEETLSLITDGDAGAVMAWARSRLSPTHPEVIRSSALFDPGRLVFLDIETLGVFSRPVFLIGSATVEGGSVRLRQFLARDIDEELPALLAWQESLPDDPLILSYNGRCFDVPYLADRCAYYGEEYAFGAHQLDLLHITRRTLGRDLSDCRLATIEETVLGLKRGFDLPGALVPGWYDTYRRSKNPGPLIPIIRHNRQDVLSLVDLHRRYLEMYR